jgi:hypothetical protein
MHASVTLAPGVAGRLGERLWVDQYVNSKMWRKAGIGPGPNASLGVFLVVVARRLHRPNPDRPAGKTDPTLRAISNLADVQAHPLIAVANRKLLD